MTSESILRAIVILISLGGSVVACGHDSPTSVTSESSVGPLRTISPASAVAGSADLTVTLKGVGFGSGGFSNAQVVWFARGTSTDLATTYVDSTQLTAVVPTALLKDVVTAEVFVLIPDLQDGPDTWTNSLVFTVTPR